MWKVNPGAAVITHTYVACEPHQMTVLTGDHVEILETSNDWILGKNVSTEKIGIFPKACAKYTLTKKITPGVYYQMSEDLIFTEAKLTLKHAIQDFSSIPGRLVIQRFNEIIDLANSLEEFSKPPEGFNAEEAFKYLGAKVITLRSQCGFPDIVRCYNYAPVSLSNFSYEHYLNRSDPIAVECRDEYLQIHTAISILQYKKPLNFRISLYSPQQLPYISEAATISVDTKVPEIDLLFDQLDPSILKKELYLVIYMDEISQIGDGETKKKCIALSFIKLQFSNGSYGKPVKFGGNSVHAEVMAGLHTKITKYTEKLEPYPVNFVIKATPYFGVTSEVVESNNLSKVPVVAPFKLPAITPSYLNRSVCNVCFSKVDHDASRGSAKLIVHVYNTQKQEYERCLDYSLDTWVSQQLKPPNYELDQYVPINLAGLESDISSLYIIATLHKTGMFGNSTTATGYAVIPLASPEGALTTKLSGTTDIVQLFGKVKKSVTPANTPIPAKTPAIGSITFKLAFSTTVLSPCQPVHAILQWESNKDKLIPALQNFRTVEVSKWIPHSFHLIVSLVGIFSSGNAREESVQALCYAINSIATNAKDHYFVIEESIKRQHPKEIVGPLTETVVKLVSDEACDPVVYSALFFIVRLCCGAQKEVGVMEASVNKLMDVLMKMTLSLPSMQAIPSVVGAIAKSFSSKFVLETVEMLEKKLDDSQIFAKKALIGMLTELANSPQWKDARVRSSLESVFERIIRRYEGEQDAWESIIDAIAAAHFSAHDGFVVKFAPTIARIAENKKLFMYSSLVDSIAYSYPTQFPIDAIISLLTPDTAEPPKTAFLAYYCLKTNVQAVKKTMADPKFPTERKAELFRKFLEKAAFAMTPSGIMIDDTIRRMMYRIENLDVLPQIFESVPEEERKGFDLFSHIFHAFSYYKDEGLRQLIFMILLADRKKDEKMQSTRRELITKLQDTGLPDYIGLREIFENPPPELREICGMCQSLIDAYWRLKKLPRTKKNEAECGDALSLIMSFCKDCGDVHGHLEKASDLYELNNKCGNKIEMAFTLSEVLSVVPCDDAIAPRFGKEAEMTGRQMHVEFNRRIIKLLMESGQEEFALDFIHRMKTDCADRFMNIELLPEIYQNEAQCYRNIARNIRIFSRYYWVSFQGNGFDRAMANKEFVYRRNSYVQPVDFVNEMKEKFPKAVFESANPEKEEQFIRIMPAFPALKGELEDPLHTGDPHRPRYIAEFEQHNFPTCFRFEPAKADGVLPQDFVHTVRALPWCTSRVEVEKKRTMHRMLSKIETAAVTVLRETSKLAQEEYELSDMLEKEKVESGMSQKFLLRVNSVIVSAKSIQLASAVKSFFTKEYLAANPGDLKVLKSFASIIKAHLSMLDQCIDLCSRACEATMKEILKNSASDLEEAKKMIQGYIAVID